MLRPCTALLVLFSTATETTWGRSQGTSGRAKAILVISNI